MADARDSIRQYLHPHHRPEGTRRYERVKERKPQVCGPKDKYCLLYCDPKQTWDQVGQDYGEALNRRFAKQNELFAKAKAGANGDKASTGARKEAPAALEELRTAFLTRKRNEKKKDRTPLDPDTIRAYEQLTVILITVQSTVKRHSLLKLESSKL